MICDEDNFLWCEKYRPKKVSECILPSNLTDIFQNYVNVGNIQHLLLAGSPGQGKTTIARALCEELGADYIIINGSLNAGIDVLRNEITSFASSVSFKGGRKYVIIDEADYLSADKVQPAFRNFMEEFSRNCGFILTCNFKNRLIAPLHSRCSVVEFNIAKKDKPVLAVQFMKRISGILDIEGVTYDKPVIAELINRHFPDWRRVLNELQRHSATGNIDKSILGNSGSDNYKTLLVALKEKNFSAARKWVGENTDIDNTTLFRDLYDKISDIVKDNSIGQLILHLAEFQYKSAFVANQEINTAAFVLSIMADCDFK